MHNPIELAWAGLKSYVRDKNVNYSLSDVRRVTYPWMTSLNRVTAVGYINETCKIQDIFKTFDWFTEEIEEQLVDQNEVVDSKAEEMIDWR